MLLCDSYSSCSQGFSFYFKVSVDLEPLRGSHSFCSFVCRSGLACKLVIASKRLVFGACLMSTLHCDVPVHAHESNLKKCWAFQR